VRNKHRMLYTAPFARSAPVALELWGRGGEDEPMTSSSPTGACFANTGRGGSRPAGAPYPGPAAGAHGTMRSARAAAPSWNGGLNRMSNEGHWDELRRSDVQKSMTIRAGLRALHLFKVPNRMEGICRSEHPEDVASPPREQWLHFWSLVCAGRVGDLPPP